MFDGQICVFNPYAEQIAHRTLGETLTNTQRYFAPFLQLLGARWLVAAQNDIFDRTTTANITSDINGDLVLTHDWFLPDLVRNAPSPESLESLYSRLVVFSDLPPTGPKPRFRPAAMNAFDIDRLARWQPSAMYRYNRFSAKAKETVSIVPMGCGQAWLPTVLHYDKIVFLDEPHESYLACYADGDDIRTRLYKHALDVCRILHSNGFHILSFCRTESPVFQKILIENPHIQSIAYQGWVPFFEIVRHYSKASLFYSFTAETFGYPLYENLQLGNGIIGYNETQDSCRFLQMQNTALLSVFMPPKIAAEIVTSFFERFCALRLRQEISNNAYMDYSSETFLKRFRDSIFESNE